jgi:hypothetical protein
LRGCIGIKRTGHASRTRFTGNTARPLLPHARYGIGVWLEKVDDGSGELLEASSQGAPGFSLWIDMERNLDGLLSV